MGYRNGFINILTEINKEINSFESYYCYIRVHIKF